MDRKRNRALFAARQALGLTQQQAASLIGVSRRTWINWEIGVHRAPQSVILALEAMIYIKTKGDLEAFLEEFSHNENSGGLHPGQDW